eukprot:scaffold47921_cov55-Attheya_sp.AAC.4
MVPSYSDFGIDVSSDDDGGRGWDFGEDFGDRFVVRIEMSRWSPMKHVVCTMTPPRIGGGLPALSHALSALGERSIPTPPLPLLHFAVDCGVLVCVDSNVISVSGLGSIVALL